MTDSLAPSSLPPLSSSPTPSFVSSNDSAASTLSSLGPQSHPCLNSTHFSAPPYALPPTPPPEDSPLGLSPEFPLATLPNASAPRAIPDAAHGHHHASTFNGGGSGSLGGGRGAIGLATPPLTPDDGSSGGRGGFAALGAKQSAFLSVLFPRNALGAAPYAKSVSISTPNTGATFDGVVLSLPGKPKTFYVDGKCAATVNLRERCVLGRM